MSRVKSRRCSDHQVINTVNNPVETHSGRSAARRVRPPPRAACKLAGGHAPHAGSAPATGCWAAWRARVCGVQSGPERDRAGPVREPWTEVGEGPCGPCCGAAAGRVRPGAAWARQRAPARQVVHLLTGQPTEVIHRCGDPVRRIASMPENRQPGRSDLGRHCELHACKLLTMWITTVENFRIRACEFRRGGSVSVCTGRGPQREGPAGERPRITAREEPGNSEGHPGGRLRPGSSAGPD